jgi:hypothetical protein
MSITIAHAMHHIFKLQFIWQMIREEQLSAQALFMHG